MLIKILLLHLNIFINLKIMKKKSSELIFISKIKRDGSGVLMLTERESCLIALREDSYRLSTLSLTEKTFIASDFNVYVVKLKN